MARRAPAGRWTEHRGAPASEATSTVAAASARPGGPGLDVDAPVLSPAGFIGAGRLERAARGHRHLRLAHAEAAEVRADRRRAPRSEAEVVLLGAARIGPADQRDRAALGGAAGQAGRELI